MFTSRAIEPFQASSTPTAVSVSSPASCAETSASKPPEQATPAV
ncbi:hypothetical protein L917_04881 [Phytophthora nicotianae]|uniref:Uncharacterized protein n=2 Tax=Phytophthora nicotianae TaxID=4792 RepID=W2LKB5_PHYNI|nr:hypothetical protein L917_04881 [Phytophthora nicotianae]ETO70686.1 hypothetical protein F444_12866 [Phytophthora nicotianae P1976]